MRYWMCALLAGILSAGAFGEVPIGTKIDNLSFKDIRYIPRTLDDLGEAEAYVFAFIGNTCPVAQRYMARFVELDREFASQGVKIVLVNASPADTIRDMAYHQIEYNAFMPTVKDWDGSVVTALGVSRTPEVVILDADRTIRYRGRVDDQYRLGGVKPEVGRHDLKEAIVEVLAGKDVSVPETQAEGCIITFPSLPEPETALSYHGDVERIINENCLQCHRKGGNAPFSLTNYKQVSARADMVAEVVSEERMPPWYAHPEFGEFSNDQRMDAKDRMIIQQWAKGDKAEGDPADAPETPTFSDDLWTIEPDVVIEAKAPNALPANGFIPYRYIFLPYEFEQDTWVQGIEIKASNPRVLHHANLFMVPEGLRFDRDQNFVTGTVPGGMPTTIQPGRGLLFPKGCKLGLQIHYVTTGKMEVDTPMVALRFAKTPIEKKIYYKILDAKPIKIPPGDPAYELKDSAKIEADSTLLALFSHMHLRGRDMTFYAHMPGGERETLLSLPNYNFDWQLTYYVDDGVKFLPEGTRIQTIAHFDNSAFNPYNPDATKTITYGPQTVDEMCQGFIFYTHNDEDLGIQVDPATGWEIETLAAAK